MSAFKTFEFVMQLEPDEQASFFEDKLVICSPRKTPVIIPLEDLVIIPKDTAYVVMSKLNDSSTWKVCGVRKLDAGGERHGPDAVPPVQGGDGL